MLCCVFVKFICSLLVVLDVVHGLLPVVLDYVVFVILLFLLVYKVTVLASFVWVCWCLLLPGLIVGVLWLCGRGVFVYCCLVVALA